MKPDWKDAPWWARYLAKDSDGFWYWHEDEPTHDEHEGYWVSSGEIEKADFNDGSWKNSLERRP